MLGAKFCSWLAQHLGKSKYFDVSGIVRSMEEIFLVGFVIPEWSG